MFPKRLNLFKCVWISGGVKWYEDSSSSEICMKKDGKRRKKVFDSFSL
jgi:hypothetical protein